MRQIVMTFNHARHLVATNIRGYKNRYMLFINTCVYKNKILQRNGRKSPKEAFGIFIRR